MLNYSVAELRCMSIVLPLYTKLCYLNIANAFSMIGAMS